MSNIKNILTSAGMSSKIDKNTGEFSVTQDHTAFIEAAKREREMGAKKDVGYKKACTIPDIVAVELNYKHGIDIHGETFMNDPQAVRKVIKIIKSEYPYLMSY